MKMFKIVENTEGSFKELLKLYKNNSPFMAIWGKKEIVLSSSLLAVIVLWYHQLKANIS